VYGSQRDDDAKAGTADKQQSTSRATCFSAQLAPSSLWPQLIAVETDLIPRSGLFQLARELGFGHSRHDVKLIARNSTLSRSTAVPSVKVPRSAAISDGSTPNRITQHVYHCRIRLQAADGDQPQRNPSSAFRCEYLVEVCVRTGQ
jgi:hypothetical protein